MKKGSNFVIIMKYKNEKKNVGFDYLSAQIFEEKKQNENKVAYL